MTPRPSDVLRFSGGLLSYEVLSAEHKTYGVIVAGESATALASVTAKRVGSVRQADSSYRHVEALVTIPAYVWADLARLCATVEEGPDGSQHQGG